MARSNIGDLHEALSEVFKQQDGLKHFLEAVCQQLMSQEVHQQLGADLHAWDFAGPRQIPRGTDRAVKPPRQFRYGNRGSVIDCRAHYAS